MSDQKIQCVDCQHEFIFSEKEQEFFKEKGFETPRRCPKCRIRRRELNYGQSDENSLEQEKHSTTCTLCRAQITVPFEPKPNRPVYCKTCLNKKSPRKNPQYK